MRVTIGDDGNEVRVADLVPGQMGKVVRSNTAPSLIGCVVLRTFTGLVALEDPNKTFTWENDRKFASDSPPDMIVQRVRKVTLEDTSR